MRRRKIIEHTHAYDEYVVVCRANIRLSSAQLNSPDAGKEFFIKKGTPTAGFPNRHRTIHAFGGKRAERVKKKGLRPSPVSVVSKTL